MEYPEPIDISQSLLLGTPIKDQRMQEQVEAAQKKFNIDPYNPEGLNKSTPKTAKRVSKTPETLGKMVQLAPKSGGATIWQRSLCSALVLWFDGSGGPTLLLSCAFFTVFSWRELLLTKHIVT